MSKTEIMSKMTRTLNRTILKVKKHSPEILMVAGTVGVVTSGVMACKATLKVNDIIEENKKDLEAIRNAAKKLEAGEKLHLEDGSEYTVEDNKKDLVVAYSQTALDFVKLYGPAVALGTASLACMIGSNRILKKRNVALAAAYTAVDKTFKEYRGRVVERFGEKLDKELRYNIKAEEIETVVVDEKTGKEKIEKEVVEVVDNVPSLYARVYDDGCIGWSKDPELNMCFLRAQQEFANKRLRAKGHLFLNEVYDMLGLSRASYGQFVGWVYDEKNPNGDNYVDFGLYNIENSATRRFINGDERNILLDFNVDGEIYDLI